MKANFKISNSSNNLPEKEHEEEISPKELTKEDHYMKIKTHLENQKLNHI